MSFFKRIESAIREAIVKSRDCPICNAGIIVTGANNEDVFYNHDCDCWLDVIVNQGIPYEEDFFEYCPDECELYDPINKNRLRIYFDELDISKDCEVCNNIPDSKEIMSQKKTYKNYCHSCKADDGVDSNDKKCIKDPPYGFTCKHCGHSLRTHEDYGEGCKFDMKNKNITWYFDKYRHPKLYEKTRSQNKTAPLPISF